MTNLSTPPAWRLNLLRAGYLLLVIGLGLTIWPAILHPGKTWELMNGVVVCMLGAMSALAVLGLRYPLQMLPLLFFEMGWKALWLARVALPALSAHRMDADTTETAFECLIAVVFLAVVPWPYVIQNYVLKSGDRWSQAGV
jgi:hypothetical protein